MRAIMILLLLVAMTAASCERTSNNEINTEEVSNEIGEERANIKAFNITDKQVGLKGFDPVSYFPEGGGEPLAGTEEFSVRYKGIVYAFANEKNLAAFKKNPDKYEPAYGGWCAWAMAQKGQKVSADPKNYLIQNGRLMVFWHNAVINAKDKWQDKDTGELEKKADTKWAKVMKTE